MTVAVRLSAAALVVALSLLRLAHAALIFRDDFAVVNASCGHSQCTDCVAKPEGAKCPWGLSLTGSLCNHSTRTIAPCPPGRTGSCIRFNVTYCGGRGASSGACYRSELSGNKGSAGPGEAHFAYGREYWFGFSLRLPDACTPTTTPHPEHPTTLDFREISDRLLAVFTFRHPRQGQPAGSISIGFPLNRSVSADQHLPICFSAARQEEIHFQMHGSPNRKLHELWRNPIFALSVLPDKDYDKTGKLLPLSGKASWEVTICYIYCEFLLKWPHF